MLATLNFQDFVTGLAFSPDGQWLLVGVDRGLLQAVYLGKEVGVNAVDLALNAASGPISPVFSADGKLAAAGMGNDVAVWETTGWKQVALLKQHQSPVSLVSFSRDGKALVSIDDQYQLASWIVP
jgi:WD40 repeat protein